MKFVLCYYLAYLCYFVFLQHRLLTHVYFHFFNVGQGDASLISSNANLLVIDGGPNYTIDYYLDNQVPFFACSLDYVVISHPHYDHIAGLTRLFRRCTVRNVIYYASDYTSKEWATLTTLMINSHKLPAYMGNSFKLSNKEMLHVLWPPTGYACGNINDCSVVVSYELKHTAVLYMGDISSTITNQLKLYKKPSLIKLPHHGARNTLTRDFLTKVSPFTGVLSFGVLNKYGHPHLETLKILAYFKAHVVKTVDGSYLVKFRY